MLRLVMKFGGTSVGSVERINEVANIVKNEVVQGNEVVVVLSAMAGETDRLVNLARGISDSLSPAEYDTVVSSGEQVSVGLLSAALNNMDINARSYMAWQIPIVTNANHKSSRIEAIRSETIINSLQKGLVCVIPGFQGISNEGRITTLGRGGSDT